MQSKLQSSPTQGRTLPTPKGPPTVPNGQPRITPTGPKKGSSPLIGNNAQSKSIITIQKYARQSIAMGNLVKLQSKYLKFGQKY